MQQRRRVSVSALIVLKCLHEAVGLLQVAVAKNKLYIVNGNYKCEGSGCDASAEAAVEAMRRMAATFDVL